VRTTLDEATKERDFLVRALAHHHLERRHYARQTSTLLRNVWLMGGVLETKDFRSFFQSVRCERHFRQAIGRHFRGKRLDSHSARSWSDRRKHECCESRRRRAVHLQEARELARSQEAHLVGRGKARRRALRDRLSMLEPARREPCREPGKVCGSSGAKADDRGYTADRRVAEDEDAIVRDVRRTLAERREEQRRLA
jgi:hypothetical protein